jgi:hypothetical protein
LWWRPRSLASSNATKGVRQQKAGSIFLSDPANVSFALV